MPDGTLEAPTASSRISDPMLSLAVITSGRRPACDYFRRAFDEAFRRYTGRQVTAPYLVMTSDPVTITVDKGWIQLLARLAACGAAGFVFADLSWYRFVPEIPADSTVRLFEPFEALAEELSMRQPMPNPAIGILAVSDVQRSTYFHQKLAQFGCRLLTPTAGCTPELDAVVANPPADGTGSARARRSILKWAQELRLRGADEIVLGSAELSAVLHPDERESQFMDLPALHAEAAARWMLGFDFVRSR